MEILDYFTLNVHGLLYKELEGLRDASVAVKLGRLNLPYDDIKACVDRATRQRMVYRRRGTDSSESNIPVTDTLGELVVPKSREEAIIQTVSDSKEFISSILRGIQEIQFAVSFFGFSKDIRVVEASGLPIYLNMSMKEVGFDLLRMDPKSPAHRMYFSPKDIAHQALIAVNSISVGIDDGHAHPERLMYIPMVTATLRTTLPSKTIQPSKGKDARERNTNMLFANLVCTSPSIDLDPSHLPLVLQLLKSRDNSDLSERKPHTERHLISRLLPKASIKVSVHEPVTVTFTIRLARISG
ncbi:Protein SABRE [Cryomyces antarcticus]|nr:Protein SABRE [Cryomyces antarcticus]